MTDLTKNDLHNIVDKACENIKDPVVLSAVATAIALLSKGNPYHDGKNGQFTSRGGGAGAGKKPESKPAAGGSSASAAAPSNGLTLSKYKVSAEDSDTIGFSMLDKHSNWLTDKVPKYHIKEIHHSATKGGTKKFTESAANAAMNKLAKKHEKFYFNKENGQMTAEDKLVNKQGYWEM